MEHPRRRRRGARHARRAERRSASASRSTTTAPVTRRSPTIAALARRRAQDRHQLRRRPRLRPGPHRDRPRHRRARCTRSTSRSSPKASRPRAQAFALRALGCEFGQGFHFGRPAPARPSSRGHHDASKLDVAFVRGTGEDLTLSVLGSFQFRAGDTASALPSGSQRLLALLALAGPVGDPVDDRGNACGPTRASSTRRRACVPRSRACAAKPAPRSTSPTSTSTSLRACMVDIRESKAFAHRLLEPNTPHLAPEATAAAVASLSADLLPDWYEDWVLIETAEWRQLRLHALEAMADNLAAEGRWAEAIAAAQAAIRGEPLRETSHAALIRVFLAEGNQTEALGQFNRYRTLLNDELSLEPTSQHLRPRHHARAPQHRPERRARPPQRERRRAQASAGPRWPTRRGHCPTRTRSSSGTDLEQDLTDPRLGDAERGADLVHLHAGHALGDDPPRAFRHALASRTSNASAASTSANAGSPSPIDSSRRSSTSASLMFERRSIVLAARATRTAAHRVDEAELQVAVHVLEPRRLGAIRVGEIQQPGQRLGLDLLPEPEDPMVPAIRADDQFGERNRFLDQFVAAHNAFGTGDGGGRCDCHEKPRPSAR